MAAPTEVIAHGTDVVQMEDRVRTSVTSLDEGTQTWCVPRRGYFRKGHSPPGYPGLRITDIDESPDAGDIIAVLTVRGLVGAARRTIAEEWRLSAEGFDECAVRVIAGSSDSWDFGEVL